MKDPLGAGAPSGAASRRAAHRDGAALPPTRLMSARSRPRSRRRPGTVSGKVIVSGAGTTWRVRCSVSVDVGDRDRLSMANV